MDGTEVINRVRARLGTKYGTSLIGNLETLLGLIEALETEKAQLEYSLIHKTNSYENVLLQRNEIMLDRDNARDNENFWRDAMRGVSDALEARQMLPPGMDTVTAVEQLAKNYERLYGDLCDKAD